VDHVEPRQGRRYLSTEFDIPSAEATRFIGYIDFTQANFLLGPSGCGETGSQRACPFRASERRSDLRWRSAG